jgi:hypothetical protein
MAFFFGFVHEFVRATPRVLGDISGYQFAALTVAALGIVAFARRRRSLLVETASTI